MASSDSPINAFKSDSTNSPFIALTGPGAFTPTCGPGEYYDYASQQCVSVYNPVDTCVFPFIFNELTGECEDPTKTGGVANPPVVTVSQGPVNVTVNNAVQITDTGIKQVASAVTQGITDATQQAADIAKATASEVINGVGDVVDKIGASADTILSKIGDVISGIYDAVKSSIGPIIGFVVDHISNIVDQVATVVKSVIVPVVDTVNSINAEVQSINDTLIQPIANIINTTIVTITSLTAAIEGDLKNGLTGLLAIPGQVATQLGSFDASLNRTVQQLGEANKTVVTETWKPVIDDTVGSHLKSIGAILGLNPNTTDMQTTFYDAVKLNEPTLRQVNRDDLQNIHKAGLEVMSMLSESWDEFIGQVKQGLGSAPGIAGSIIEGGTWLASIITVLAVTAEPFFEYVKGEANKKLPLSKLSSGDALQAWVRNFISASDLNEELAVLGLDAGRIQALKDLQQFLIAVPDIVDMYFRGIVTESDARNNMSAHAISKVDQDAILKAAFKLFSPATAAVAYRYGFINIDQFKNVLLENRYTVEEADAVAISELRPEGVQDVIERHKRDVLFDKGLTRDTFFKTVPQDVADAAKADGLSPGIAYNQWRSQFRVPSIDEWINLYFRGIRTRTELEDVFDYNRVPKEWRDDAIQARHALIPFRTIPTMLASGIISEAYARQQLTAHGFDLQAVNALLDYSKTKKTAASATTATGINSLSVGVAKSYWDHGALTDAQYHDVLIAHGYNEQEAALTVQVQTLEHSVADRKQIATDIINEVLSGLITVDQAQQQMAANQFTVAENAKVLAKIARTQRATSKTPSESQLAAFWKKEIITTQDFRDGLATLGYAAKWVDAFAAEIGAT